MTQASLRAQLTRWVLLPMIMMLLGSTLLVYRTTLQLSTTPYDHALREVALILQDRLHPVNGEIELDLPSAAQEVLLQDPRDRLFYAVRGTDGPFIAGQKGLPFPPYTPGIGQPVYYDAHHAGQPVRVVALDALIEGIEVTIVVAETTNARSALIRETTLTLLIPVVLLLGLVLLWTIFGLTRALQPLDRLRNDVSCRTALDLAPLSLHGVPLEVQPLVAEINGLLMRLKEAQDSQRRFIADAAHQLRTPLASLRAYADLAGREHHDPAALRHDLDRLHTATERASRLIQQLLSLARTEPGAETGMQWQDV